MQMTAPSPQRVQAAVEAYIARMPSLPTTMNKVLAICNNPKASANDLNRVISLDPVLTGKVLKLINSAYYSFQEPISSLTRALIMLGINTVKNLALSSAFIDTLRGPGAVKSALMEDFWLHSLSTAVTTRILAVITGVPSTEREAYFVTGFLHDIGKIPLISLYEDHYRRVLQQDHRDSPRMTPCGEEAVFGIGHCEIGALIAKKWRLGPQIVGAVRAHHEKATAETDFCVKLVSAANDLTYWRNPGNHDTIPDEAMHARLRAAGIDAGRLEDMNRLVSQELEKAKIFLELDR